MSYGQSSGDTEALHQAYRHIAHSLGDTGEPIIKASTVENVKSSVKDYLQENEESSKNISTTESGKGDSFGRRMMDGRMMDGQIIFTIYPL